jgi:hypothetical protein
MKYLETPTMLQWFRKIMTFYCIFLTRIAFIFPGQQTFRIDIADKNDHAPVFEKKSYEADNIPEDANINRQVRTTNTLGLECLD